jgi:hypothetical protein
MDTKGTKPLDCYLNGIKSPERIEPNSNIVGNLRRKPVEDKRADAFLESPTPLAERTDAKRR